MPWEKPAALLSVVMHHHSFHIAQVEHTDLAESAGQAVAGASWELVAWLRLCQQLRCPASCQQADGLAAGRLAEPHCTHSNVWAVRYSVVNPRWSWRPGGAADCTQSS